MNTLEGRAWRALAAARGMGPAAMWRIADYLFSRQRTASWLLRNPEKTQEALGSRGTRIVLPDPDTREYAADETAAGEEMTILHPLHPAFPPRIRERRERLMLPAVLYASGNLSLLKGPGVAIVGRRDAAVDALAVAGDLAAHLAAKGIGVFSGHAAGIDAAAHGGALGNGGSTVAVLAEGLGRFQVRPGLKGLLTAENALVVSQFPPLAAWAAFQAMARNKVVAGLADALVVVVSGPKRDGNGRMSGTFDAALAALKLGIPLFVVAPSFFAAAPAGNRDLLREGGMAWDPVAGPGPILEAIGRAKASQAPAQRKLF